MPKGPVGKVMKEELGSISVQYRFVDGYHIFTSMDVKGLHVALKDPKRAYDAVAEVLSALISHKTGEKNLVIEPTIGFEEWMGAMRNPSAQRRRRPNSVHNRNYVVRRQAA